MQVAQTENLLFVLGLFTATAAFVGVVFLLNSLIAPKNPGEAKGAPYECGLEQAGSPFVAQRLRFSTVAVLFVIFDANVILLFAVASRLHGDLLALVKVFAFIGVLALGLGYAWRKGALEWRL